MAGYFDLEAANAELPRIVPLLRQALWLQAHLRVAVARLAASDPKLGPAELAMSDERPDLDGPSRRALYRARALHRALREVVAEIERPGIEVRSVSEGLIAFRAHAEAVGDVSLSWRLEERVVEHWHFEQAEADERLPVRGLRFSRPVAAAPEPEAGRASSKPR